MFAKDKNRQQTKACIVKEKVLNNLSIYFEQHAQQTDFKTSENWVVLSSIEKQIKEKIEAVGKPLKEWDININYGIKTGFNEAFIITKEKRKELIEQDPNSADIIRPILRGRDIKRYAYEFADLYVITTFPSLKIDIELYPAIKHHLISFGYDRLKQTGDKGARKKTNNKWFETQDSISYWEDFDRQKIIWIELVDKGRFALDASDKYLTLNGTFIMIGEDLEFICSILNNPVTSWHFNTFCISSGVGTNQWRELYVKELYIPNIPKHERQPLLDTFNELMVLEKTKQSVDHKIKELNNMVYSIFKLTPEEIEFIEHQ